jgi:hypothetical protein
MSDQDFSHSVGSVPPEVLRCIDLLGEAGAIAAGMLVADPKMEPFKSIRVADAVQMIHTARKDILLASDATFRRFLRAKAELPRPVKG